MAGGFDGYPIVISALSHALEIATEENDAAARRAGIMTCSDFHAVARPSIPIREFLRRIFRYADCSPSVYVVAYIYLDRFTRRHPSIPIDSLDVHLLLITSVLAAAKFLERTDYSNAYFARVGGISTAEMNALEVKFLVGVGYNLFVTPADFHLYSRILQWKMCHLDSPRPPPGFRSCLPDEEPDTSQHQQLTLSVATGTVSNSPVSLSSYLPRFQKMLVPRGIRRPGPICRPSRRSLERRLFKCACDAAT